MSVCAVIPAAGRGSRLGLHGPKILAPIDDSLTIFDVLRNTLLEHVDQLHVIVSPDGMSPVHHAIQRDPEHARISLSVQEKPTGMGDAIFCAYEVWREFDDIFVVWGDQVFLSPGTVRTALCVHASAEGPRFTLPLTRLPTPYVQYDLDRAKRLVRVRQKREGDIVDAEGSSDVGAFLLSTAGLRHAWEQYLTKATRGSATGEINFLPFLPYLPQRLAWHFLTFDVADPVEARGINEPDDLRFAQERFARVARRRV
jgi:bifunctional UDP-N-acetylglucosamine pyrophosphorylase / glucosamine-1-phosphate N-acetyltransferase